MSAEAIDGAVRMSGRSVPVGARSVAMVGGSLMLAMVLASCATVTPVAEHVATPRPEPRETRVWATRRARKTSLAVVQTPTRAPATPVPPAPRIYIDAEQGDEPLLGLWDPGWVAHDVAFDESGRFLYVAGGHAGLDVVDLSDPAQPLVQAIQELESAAPWPRSAAAARAAGSSVVRVDQGRLLVSRREGIDAFDLAQPAMPARWRKSVYVGYTGHVPRFASTEEWLFTDLLTAGPAAIPIVEDGGFGQELELDIPAPWVDAAVDSAHLYLVHGEYGLSIVDIRDPTQAFLIGTYEPEWSMDRITLAGDRAYVVGEALPGYGGLHVLDVSDPARPVEVAHRGPSLDLDIDGMVAGVAAVAVDRSGERVALLWADGRDHWLEILDAASISDGRPENALRLTGQGPTGEPRLAMAGDRVAVALGEAGLRVVDISDADAPRLLSAIEAVVGVWDLAVDGDTAYAVTWDHGLRIVDVSNVEEPVERGIFDPEERLVAAAVADGVGYVGAGDLHVLDVSDPSAPTVIGRWSPGAADRPTTANAGRARVDDIWLEGDLAYTLTSDTDLVALDIRDPAHPVELSRSGGGGSGNGRLCVADGFAYLAAGWQGLRIVDVRDPTNLVEMGSYRSDAWSYDESRPNAWRFAADVWVDQGMAYVAAEEDGLHVIDVSDPLRPRLHRHLQPMPIHNRHAPDVHTVTGIDGQLVLGSGFGAIEVFAIADLVAPVQDTKLPLQPIRTVFSDGMNRSFVIDDGRLFAAASLSGLRILDFDALARAAE